MKSSQQEQAWELCGDWTVPKAGGHQGGGTPPPRRLDKRQGAAQDQTGSSAPAPSMARFCFAPYQGALTEPQGHPPLPHSRALGGPGSSVPQKTFPGSSVTRLYMVSPILLLLAFFNKYLVLIWQRSSTTLSI